MLIDDDQEKGEDIDNEDSPDDNTKDTEIPEKKDGGNGGDEGKSGEESGEDEKDDGAEPEGTAGTPPKNEKSKESEDDEEEDEDLSDEDQKKIGKYFDKRIAPLQDSFYSNRVEADIQSILAQNPEYKKYEPRIRRFVTHPNRSTLIKQGLPVKTVVLEAMSPYLGKIAAQKTKAADEKADLTKNDGSSSRPTTSGEYPDFSKMSNKQIEETAELVKSGRFKAK